MNILSQQNLVVSLEDRDAEELVLVLQGYYRLLTENPLAVTHIRDRNSVDQGRCRSRVVAEGAQQVS